MKDGHRVLYGGDIVTAADVLMKDPGHHVQEFPKLRGRHKIFGLLS